MFRQRHVRNQEEALSGSGRNAQAYVKASNPEISDGFAIVALSGDTLAVDAFHEDSCATGFNGDQGNNGCLEAGAVYVYVAQ